MVRDGRVDLALAVVFVGSVWLSIAAGVMALAALVWLVFGGV